MQRSVTSSQAVLVTGGTRGIGQSICQLLLAKGYDVFFTGSSKKTIHQGAAGTGLPLNLSDPLEIESFVKQWDHPLYALINNAGACLTANLGSDNAEDVWWNIIQVNLNSVFHLSNGLLKHIVDKGRIINISSQLGVDGRAGYSAYCASKFALNGLTKVWAKELGARGITVNSICPGWVETDMTMNDIERIASTQGISKDVLYKNICSQLELKRMNKPEEIAELAAYLLSESASGMSGREFLLQTIWNEMQYE